MTINITPNKDAAALIMGKAAVTPAAYKSLLPDLRARAFTVARISDFDVLRDIMEAIAKIPEGADWKKTRTQIAAEISPYMDESPDGVSASRKKAELLLRTHGYQAYAVGKHAEQTASAAALPWWKYVSVGDGKVRDAHRALDGKIFRSDDPFWKDHYPPWDFGCRCQVVAVTAQEVARIEAAEEAAGKSEAERSVPRGDTLEGARKGRLNTGPYGVADVRAPVDKVAGTDRLKAYQFDPRNLRPDAADLKARYPKEVYDKFEAAMRTETVRTADGRDIPAMDWIGDAKS
jgi:SPP1 gp7 family putative phage head morphogenesis protein